MTRSIRTIALVGCCAEKLERPAPAYEMYRSPLFRLCLAYAERTLGAETLVLSAKHGLMELDDEIEPYDLALSSMTRHERERWTNRVHAQFCRVLDLPSGRGIAEVPSNRRPIRVVMLAGALYRFELPIGCELEEPLKGLGIGSRLSWLRARVPRQEAA